jgi:hypothetical protein
MKHLIIIALSLILFGSLRAGTAPSTFEKLNGINSYWMQQPHLVKQFANAFSSQTMNDHQLIQLHLQLVETVLRNKDVSKLTEQQRDNRIQYLNNLHSYWNTNIYPINNKTAKRNPVFIDDYNTFCAVGYLMKTSGFEDLARNIATTQNLSYVRTIRAEGLAEWISNSGFTQDELAWIQPTYTNPNQSRPLSGGVNGPVYALAGNDSAQILYVGGQFSIANQQTACNNIVAINYNPNNIFSNTFTPLAAGVNGTVNALFLDKGILYAGGNFDSSGNTPLNNIAKWNGNSWESMGELNGTVNCIASYQNNIVVGGSFTFTSGGHTYQNLAYWNGIEWKPFNHSMNGEVKALTNYADMLVVGGSFTQVDTTTVNYVCAYLNQQLIPLGQGLKAPVQALSVLYNYVYAGGQFTLPNSDSIFGLARYFQGADWEKDMINPWVATVDSTYYIKAIAGNYMAGSFETVFTGKANVGSLYISSNTGIIAPDRYNPFASPSGPVSAILPLGKRVFFGGQFSSIWCGYGGGRSLEFSASNLGTWDPDYVGLRTVDPVWEKFNMSPNPTTNETTIQSPSAIQSLSVYDLNGRKVWDQTLSTEQNELTLPRSVFPSSGMYFIQLKTKNGLYENQKLMVE